MVGFVLAASAAMRSPRDLERREILAVIARCSMCDNSASSASASCATSNSKCQTKRVRIPNRPPAVHTAKWGTASRASNARDRASLSLRACMATSARTVAAYAEAWAGLSNPVVDPAADHDFSARSAVFQSPAARAVSMSPCKLQRAPHTANS